MWTPQQNYLLKIMNIRLVSVNLKIENHYYHRPS